MREKNKLERKQSRMSDSFPSAQKSQAYFVAGTVFQIYMFLFQPWLYKEAAPELDVPHFVALRLIACMEIGLMSMYLAGIWTRDYLIAALTSLIRFTVVLHLLTMVLAFGGPWALMLGIVQDVIGASATTYFLIRDWNSMNRKRQLSMTRDANGKPVEGCPEAEYIVRVLILIAGIRDAMEAGPMYLNPASYSDMPLITLPDQLMKPSVYLGARSVAYMMFDIAVYQIALAVFRAPLIAYFSIAFYHLTFTLSVNNLGTIVHDEVLTQGLHAPSYHLPAGLIIAMACFILFMSRIAPMQAPPLSRKKQP